MMAFTLVEPSNSSTWQAPSQKAHMHMVCKETCTRVATSRLAHKHRKPKGSGKHGPTKKKVRFSSSWKSTAPSSWAAKQKTAKKFNRSQKSKREVSPHAPGCPHVPCPADPLEHWPFDAEWFEESESDEVSGGGSEGPEKVLPQVSLLQGEVLVGFQAGAHLRRWVDVLFPQGLLAKVLVLGKRKAKGQKRVMSCFRL